VVLGVACGGTGRAGGRFALRPPMQRDDDAQPFAPRPARYESSQVGAWIDATFMRPVENVLAVDVTGPAVNVNALEEVPDSSWFTNRWPTPDDVAAGPCRETPVGDPDEGWTVTEAKDDGLTAGFFARDSAGRRYLVKFDVQAWDFPEISTTADVVGSRLYWAAGFNAPCNEVILLDPARLHVAPDAHTAGAHGARALSAHDLAAMLARLPRRPDGRLRATASRIISGEILGPWRYVGRRGDDPNDVVAHDDRREVRGARVLAAWLNHGDAREANTLDAFVPDGDPGAGRGHVVHYLIDFGDCLGLPSWPAERVFDVARFDPERWATYYPNPAFARALPADRAWMARVLSRLGVAHVRAAMARAHVAAPALAGMLTNLLVGRWQRVLERYLRGGDALGEVSLRGDALCAVDLPLRAGIPAPGATTYTARTISPPGVSLVVRPGDPAQACADLAAVPRAPAAGALPDDAPARYRVIELRGRDAVGAVAALRAHLYDLGPARGFVLVGVTR
jgi:hypothetical protein